MHIQHMFCSARDRDVRVAVTEQPVFDAQAPVHDAELVCLEIGEPCSGAICPLLATPIAILRFRLAHEGFDTSLMRHLAAPCADCGRTTELLAVDRTHVYCTECGAVHAWHAIPDDAPTFD